MSADSEVHPTPHADHEDVDNDDNDDDGSGVSLQAVVARRLLKLRFHPAELAGSVLTSLGQNAYIGLSSVCALSAVGIDFIGRRLRTLDSIHKYTWLQAKVDSIMAHTLVALEGLKFQHMARQAFDTVDGDSDGALDVTELYCCVLLLYVNLGMYIPRLSPPTREQVGKMFAAFDMDRNGTLDKQEFQLLAGVYCEVIALRVASQTVISLVLAPWIALRLCRLLTNRMPAWLVAGMTSIRAAPKMQTVSSFLFNEVAAVAGVVAVIVSLGVPFVHGVIDELYLLRAARNTARALAKMRRPNANARKVPDSRAKETKC